MAQKFLSDIHATAGVKDSSGDLGTSGQVLSSTGSLTNWVNPTVGTTVIYKDAFTATNGQTAFTLANTVDSEDKTQVYIDGAYQSKGGYTVSGTTLTFDTGLETSSAVEVITFSTATANNAASAVKLDTFTGDGSDLTFVLSEAVVDEKVTQVYINGVYQNKSTYSIAADLVTLTFGSGNAPPNSSAIEVISFKTITSTDGTLTATTFLGDLNGTINTATTATTQSAGNNSTKISTTAYTDAKVAEAITNGTTGIAPSQDVVFDALALKSNIAGPTFTGTPAAPTASAGTNTTQLATTAFVNTGIANIVDSAPGTLNTLNELAAALGDDVNFSTTVTDSIATKLPLAGGTLTGAILIQQSSSTGFTTEKTGGTGSFINLKDNAGSVFIGGVNSEFVVQTPGSSYSNKLTISSGGDATFNSSGDHAIIVGTGASSHNVYVKLNAGSGGNSYINSIGQGQLILGANGAASNHLLISSTGAATFNSSLAGFGATITNNNDSSQGLLVRTSDNDGDEYILDLQSSSSATGTNYASKFKVAKGGDVTLNGNGTTSALLFGQSSYARIINTSGQTLYVDSDVHEFRTSGGVGKLTISSAGAIGQAVTPLTDPYVASGEQWMTYQIGKGGIFAAYKNNNESMFGFNTYTKVTDGAHKAIISNIGGSATRYYADRITFNTLTTSGTAQTQTEVMRVLANGKVGIGTTSPIEKLQVAGQIISTGSNSTSATAGAERAIMDLSAFSSTDHSARFGHFRGTNSAGAGQLRLYTDSVERLRIDASGKVGIGTTAPAQKLHILHPSYLSTSTIQGLIRLTGQSNSENSGTIPSAGTSIEFYNKWSGGSEYSVARISGRASQGYDGGLQFDVGSNSGPGQSGFTTALSILANGVVSGDLNDTSDVSLKKDIQSLGDSTELVKKLNPVSFYWNKEHKGKNKNIGFIAQQVEEVLPELVKGDEGSKSINVTGLVSLLTKSIQEQQTIIEDLKSRIETLEG